MSIFKNFGNHKTECFALRCRFIHLVTMCPGCLQCSMTLMRWFGIIRGIQPVKHLAFAIHRYFPRENSGGSGRAKEKIGQINKIQMCVLFIQINKCVRICCNEQYYIFYLFFFLLSTNLKKNMLSLYFICELFNLALGRVTCL